MLVPNVVVYIPILKLANKNIPSTRKKNDASLDNTMLANNPMRRVTIHNMFPNNEECRDFEYSFFFVNLVSNSWVTANTPIIPGSLYQISFTSKLFGYPKYVVIAMTAAIINDAAREK